MNFLAFGPKFALKKDAIALAIRFSCPIYIYGDILETSGIVLIEEPEEGTDEYSSVSAPIPSETEKTDFTIYTFKELEKMLNEALTNEDYEKAAKIRDELTKREK